MARACAGARAQMLRRCGKARASGWAKRRALPCGLCVCAAVTQPGHSCGPRAGLCLPHDSTAAASRFPPHAGPPDRRASGSAAGPVYVFAFAAPGAARPGGKCSGGGSGSYDG